MGTLILAILLTAVPPEIEVQTLDGRTIVGRMVELTADRVTIETSQGPISWDADKLLGISPRQKPAAEEQSAGAWIELVDGSTLVAREYSVHDRQARVTLGNGEVIETPAGNVASVRFQSPSEAIAAEWARMLGMKLDGDMVLVRTDENVDYHKGVLHDVTDKTVEFELDGDVIPIKRAKVFGLIYYHAADRQLPQPVCHVSDTTGSRWSVGAIEWSGQLQWTTPGGVTVVRPWETLAHIDFSGGKIVYLSELKAESVQWTPFFGMQRPQRAIAEFYAPRMDQNLASKPLQLDGKQYPKGIALHSRTEMVYRLPGRFSRLKALAGIDDGVRPQGNVRLLVRGDDKVLWEAVLTGADPPQPLDLDLSGVHRLVIFVDFGGETDAGDHLDLCNARIIK